AQVASALAATHAARAVHGELQGESVLVREDGSAVLVGFGGGEGHWEAGAAEDVYALGESVKEGREPKPGGFRLEVPKNPRPGQLRPPCKPPRVVINGGCWGHLIGEKPPCGDGAYEWE